MHLERLSKMLSVLSTFNFSADKWIRYRQGILHCYISKGLENLSVIYDGGSVVGEVEMH